MKQIIAIFTMVIYLTAYFVPLVHAELEEPVPQSSIEETTERLLVVPLQEEGPLPIPIPFYKKPWFWVTVTAVVAGGVWCSKNCNPDPSQDATLILESFFQFLQENSKNSRLIYDTSHEFVSIF